MTERLEGETGLARAVELLRAGELVAIPKMTEAESAKWRPFVCGK